MADTARPNSTDNSMINVQELAASIENNAAGPNSTDNSMINVQELAASIENNAAGPNSTDNSMINVEEKVESKVAAFIQKNAAVEKVEIYVEEVAASIQKNVLWSQNSYMSPKSCIFTTPNILFRHNERAYIPTAFSIGPLHHGKDYLKPTEKLKYGYLRGLVSRRGIQVEELVRAIAELEPEAREHYASEVEFTPTELVEILVLDGCFIIELFRKGHSLVDLEPGDPIFDTNTMRQHLDNDLILLENQIPWIVLDRLFTITSEEEFSLLTLAVEEIGRFTSFRFDDYAKLAQEMESNMRPRHLLDLLRGILVHSSPNAEPNDEDEDWLSWLPIPSVTELENAGVTLKKGKSSEVTISFKNGVLEISPLMIDDTTELIFRNIIAFEQCCAYCPPIFTSYAILLDNLINTTEDMNRLNGKGIMNILLDPDEAVDFFNKLYQDTRFYEFYYTKVCKDIKEYRQRSWPTWRAALVRNYFSNPWVIASTIAACALLALTFLQTLYAMKG